MSRKKVQITKTGHGKLALVLFAISALILIVGFVFFYATKSDPKPQPNSNPPLSVEAIEGAEEKTPQGAIEKARTMLEVANTVDNLEENMSKLEEGDFSVLPEGFDSFYAFPDGFPELLQAVSYQIPFAVNVYVEKAGGTLPISEINPDAVLDVVYLDEPGIAYIPVSVFSGQPNPIMLEMVYVSGEWKFSPLMTLEAIKFHSENL